MPTASLSNLEELDFDETPNRQERMTCEWHFPELRKLFTELVNKHHSFEPCSSTHFWLLFALEMKSPLLSQELLNPLRAHSELQGSSEGAECEHRMKS